MKGSTQMLLKILAQLLQRMIRPFPIMYINASWMNEYDHEHAFVASQGPHRSTVEQLEHMLWQKNVKVIVMLTNLFEDEKNKCEMYWPLEVGQTAAHVRVKIKMVEENYVIRQSDFNLTYPSSTSSTPTYFSNVSRIQMLHSWPQSPLFMAAFINVMARKQSRQKPDR